MKNQIDFTYPEDESFFAGLLTDNGASVLDERDRAFFDFREPQLKRAEFNRIKGELLKGIIRQGRMQCELHVVPGCEGSKLVLDHIIPLSSNELNKHLRKMRAPLGKKVPAQSFGSNDPINFLVACEKCNSFKKHRFIRKARSGWVLYDFGNEKTLSRY